MSNRTQINPNISSLASTVINAEVGQSIVVNSITDKPSKIIETGTLLAGKFKIIEQMGVSTGEADLYLCEYNNDIYVAKIYRRKAAIKPEVVDALKLIKSPYIATLIESDSYNGLSYEILPYYPNGSLEGKKFTFDELKDKIIPCINEALKTLHSSGIIHKDLKPSNIMLLDDNKGVAIIDFGISSVVENGNTVLVTKTGMTPEYSAPETFKNLFLEESDYYSFGITLFELFYGKTPYKNISAEEIAQFIAVQRIPFPKDVPEALRNLISGITYSDITNRNNKSNPNRRWTYDEVNNWCCGKKQAIPGEGIGKADGETNSGYSFLNKKYTDIPSLITALAEHWNDGKKELYRGLLSSYFKNFNSEIAGICMEAEDESTRINGNDDIIFWRLLYKIQPDLSLFYWKGRCFETLPALGREMLDKLWNKDKTDYMYWDEILSEKLLSTYLARFKAVNKNLTDSVQALEASYDYENKSKHDIEMNYYLMAYLLSGQKLFHMDNQQFKNVSELASQMKYLIEFSYEKFEEFCHSMIDYNNVIDVQLEAWLVAIGKRKEIEKWRKELSE